MVEAENTASELADGSDKYADEETGQSSHAWEVEPGRQQADDPWWSSGHDPWKQQSWSYWHRGWKWHDSVGWYQPWEESGWGPSGGHVARVEETTMGEDGRWHGAAWKESQATSTTRSEESAADAPLGGRPTERMVVPDFDGEGNEQELGRSAGSYVRRVHAWLKCTKMAAKDRALALYTQLKGRAWIAAEELSVEMMHDEGGVDYFLDWIRIRFMEIEVTKVASVMAELFRKCKKRSEQSVREFNLEYERLLMHLRELDCELPPLVKAWLYLDKLRLGESEETSILSSVNNKYDLKLLQQAALLHDRSTRRPVSQREKGDHRPRWNKTIHLTELDEEEESVKAPQDDNEDNLGSDDELVTEEVAVQYHDAFMAFQDAKSKYREAIKGRGYDRGELKKKNEERLRAAKARSYCSVCKRKGHWHRDPECPMFGQAAPGGQHKKEAQAKSVQLCHVYMTGEACEKDSKPDDWPERLEQFKRRLPAMKARSHCSHCRQQGHWQHDPECPMSKVEVNDGEEKVGDAGKKDEACGIYMAGNTANWEGKGLSAIADTACSRTVAGYDWFERYCKFADEQGIAVETVDESEKFRFGASRIHESSFSVWAKFVVEGQTFAVNVAIVACRVPLLFSRSVLSRLGMVYRLEEGVADLETLGVKKLKLGVSETGYPTIPVTDYGDGLKGAKISVFDHGWGEDPDIRFLASEQYMPAAVVQTGHVTETCIFYPKKVSPAVHAMLTQTTLSPVAFYPWWKSASQSRDFWIETKTHLYRIHVVPRMAAFKPSAWKTTKTDLYQKLLDTLHKSCTVEAVPCNSDGVFVHQQILGNWHEVSEDEYQNLTKHGLWIGRSCFPRLPSSCAETNPVPKTDVSERSAQVAMEDEQGRADCRGACDGSGGAPKLDSAGVESHSYRAAGDPVSCEGEEPALKGLTQMTLSQLTERAVKEGLSLPPRPTRGLLMRMLRDKVQLESDNVMNFGKFRGWLYQEVPTEYTQWAVKEAEANANSSPDLVRFASWAKTELQRQDGVISSLPRRPNNKEDPEVKAMVPCPDIDVMTWTSSMASTGKGSSAASSKKSDKRRAAASVIEVEDMDSELSPEAIAEIQQAEAKLAAVKQKHRARGTKWRRGWRRCSTRSEVKVHMGMTHPLIPEWIQREALPAPGLRRLVTTHNGYRGTLLFGHSPRGVWRPLVWRRNRREAPRGAWDLRRMIMTWEAETGFPRKTMRAPRRRRERASEEGRSWRSLWGRSFSA